MTLEPIRLNPQALGGLRLRETLDCGQAFRWRQLDGCEAAQDSSSEYWTGTAGSNTLTLRQAPDGLYFYCSREDFQRVWRPYFDLDTDYGAKKQALRKIDPVLRDAIDYAPGIRLLRQEPFETMCAFILSQNCNIPRIKGMIQRLCALCGTPITGEAGAYGGAESPLSAGIPGGGIRQYAFPTAEALARQTPESLAPVRAGFRGKYLLSAACMVADGKIDLEEIRRGSVEFGREQLQSIHGIGPKVAECTLLFGFHKLEAFPIDVWMRRVMDILFPGKTPEIFGADAGLAQQYLFHYSRMHPEMFR